MKNPTSQPMSAAKKIFLGTVFPWMVIVVGISAIALGVQEVRNGQTSEEWPGVEGKIVSASVETQRGTDNRRPTYHAKILYDYTLDGDRLTGDRVMFGSLGWGDPSDAQKIVDQYPKGMIVTVYYNPDNHSQALLEPGPRAGEWFFVWLGIPFLLLGMVMLRMFPKLLAT